MPRQSPYSVLVVGLDGATFDLMLPWIAAGHLPRLGQLLRNGAHSPLESTIPPITPCAWSSFMTGKNPGKHGLFDFIAPTDDGHGFQFTNASYREGESLWGCLSRHQRKVGVVNVPMTYPPEPVNGFLISGLDTPHEHSPFMHPTSLKGELREAGIRYRIDQQHLGNMRTNARRQRQLQEILAAESSRTQAFQYLSHFYPADFRMIVYGATDQVQHHFWHYLDPTHDKYDKQGATQFRHAIRDTYIHIDHLLGELLDDCGNDTIVVIMSDHGFGPTSNVRLRLNQVLEQARFLTFQPSAPTGALRRTLGSWLDALLRSTLSPDLKRTLAGLLPRLRLWFENLDEAAVDWSRTRAYVNEAYRSSPAVWLHHHHSAVTQQSAEQHGHLAGGHEHEERLIDQVTSLLLALRDPQTDRPVIRHVYRPHDLYHGPHTHKAPHLLPSWWEDGFLLEQSDPGRYDNSIECSSAPIQGGVEFAGSHRLDGVFMIAGEPVKRDFSFPGAHITDVAPTILYLMGLPIPADMDGHVLTECLDEAFVARHPVEREGPPKSDTPTPPPVRTQAFSDDESELIARRLQALGYLQ